MLRPWPYVIAALLLASVTAGVAVGLEMAIFIGIAALIEGGPPNGILFYSAFSAAIAAPVFFIGLVFPGGPVWLWLHGIGRRSYSTAAVAVAVGASVMGVILSSLAANPMALFSIFWLALPGAAAGLVLRWTAYGPRLPQPSPPAAPAPPA